MATTGKKLGDLAVTGLIGSALSELRGLEEHLDKADRSDEMFDTITQAYYASIATRLTMARIKVGEIQSALGGRKSPGTPV